MKNADEKKKKKDLDNFKPDQTKNCGSDDGCGGGKCGQRLPSSGELKTCFDSKENPQPLVLSNTR